VLPPPVVLFLSAFRRRLGVLFNFAKRRGYVTENPIADVERAKERETEVEILSVGDVVRLLECASAEMLPFWAIGAFAGLRRAEIERLSWSEVDLDADVIEVKASKSKTASRRLVTVQPNLHKWLAPYRAQAGRICPVNLQRKINDDRDRAGLLSKWPQNALRHSFGSYHLAQFNDAAKLALEMGNSPATIFRHYRQLESDEESTEGTARTGGKTFVSPDEEKSQSAEDNEEDMVIHPGTGERFNKRTGEFDW
jgi:integrase